MSKVSHVTKTMSEEAKGEPMATMGTWTKGSKAYL